LPRILRAGLITKEMIEKVAGGCEIAMHKETDKVRSPGVKYTHYKPKCDTMLFESDQVNLAVDAYKKAESQGKKAYLLCTNAVAKLSGVDNVLALGESGEEVASNLYDKLLEGEKIADVIIAVALPDEKGVNLGVMNRLRKSCG
jgi:L-threonylcarbamoyladenylate synthase